MFLRNEKLPLTISIKYLFKREETRNMTHRKSVNAGNLFLQIILSVVIWQLLLLLCVCVHWHSNVREISSFYLNENSASIIVQLMNVLLLYSQRGYYNATSLLPCEHENYSANWKLSCESFFFFFLSLHFARKQNLLLSIFQGKIKVGNLIFFLSLAKCFGKVANSCGNCGNCCLIHMGVAPTINLLNDVIVFFFSPVSLCDLLRERPFFPPPTHLLSLTTRDTLWA